MDEIVNQNKELEELVNQIKEAMKLTQKSQTQIDQLTQEWRNETRPVMVTEKEQEIEKQKAEKEEFDEMTKNAILNAEKENTALEKQIEEKFNSELIRYAQREKDIEEKLAAMLQRATTPMQIVQIESKASEAKENLIISKKQLMENQSVLRNTIMNRKELFNQYADELGFADELKQLRIQLAQEENVEKVADPALDPTAKPGADSALDPTAKTGADPSLDPTAKTGEDPSLNPTANPGADPALDPTAKTQEKAKVDPLQGWWKSSASKKPSAIHNFTLDPKKHKVETEKLDKIILNPIEQQIYCYLTGEGKKTYKYGMNAKYNYHKEEIETVKNASMYEQGVSSSIMEAIDPSLVRFLCDTQNQQKLKYSVQDYFEALAGKDKGVKISYDLTDIYKSDLNYKEIRNMKKIMKASAKSTKGMIGSVENRDNLFKNFFGATKKLISYYTVEKIAARSEKEEKAKTEKTNKKSWRRTKGKDPHELAKEPPKSRKMKIKEAVELASVTTKSWLSREDKFRRELRQAGVRAKYDVPTTSTQPEVQEKLVTTQVNEDPSKSTSDEAER